MLLANSKSVDLPPLHIKLSLMKKFVKAMDVNGNEFQYLQNKFCSEKCNPKLKAGVFIGPEIPRLIKDLELKHHLKHLELPDWESFIQVVENFGYHREMITTLNLSMICFQLITRCDVACHKKCISSVVIRIFFHLILMQSVLSSVSVFNRIFHL